MFGPNYEMCRTSISVEFLGLPGAGKSELSRRVAQILAARGIPVDQPSYVLAHGLGLAARAARKSTRVLREAALHPGRTSVSARAIAGSGQPSLFVFGKMLFNWLLVSDLVRTGRRTAGVHLYDQGVFQALWSIGFGGDAGSIDGLAGELWGQIPLPDVVTVLEASIPTVEQRLRACPEFDSRIDSLVLVNPEILLRCLEMLEKTKRVLEEIASRHNQLRSLVIKNETRDDMEREAQRLASMIQDRLATGPAEAAMG